MSEFSSSSEEDVEETVDICKAFVVKAVASLRERLEETKKDFQAKLTDVRREFDRKQEEQKKDLERRINNVKTKLDSSLDDISPNTMRVEMVKLLADFAEHLTKPTTPRKSTPFLPTEQRLPTLSTSTNLGGPQPGTSNPTLTQRTDLPLRLEDLRDEGLVEELRKMFSPTAVSNECLPPVQLTFFKHYMKKMTGPTTNFSDKLVLELLEEGCVKGVWHSGWLPKGQSKTTLYQYLRQKVQNQMKRANRKRKLFEELSTAPRVDVSSASE